MEVLSEGASRAEGRSSSAPRQRGKAQSPFANNESSFAFLFGPLTTQLYTLTINEHWTSYSRVSHNTRIPSLVFIASFYPSIPVQP